MKILISIHIFVGVFYLTLQTLQPMGVFWLFLIGSLLRAWCKTPNEAQKIKKELQERAELRANHPNIYRMFED